MRFAIGLATGVLLVVLGVAIGLALPRDTRTQAAPGRVTTFELPAAPIDIELVEDTSGYATLGDGRIIRFDVREEIEWVEVASGLRFPRGLAVSDDTLYTVELGELTCDPSYPECVTTDAAAERKRLAASDGRLIAFDIGANGTLHQKRTVLGRLPVVGRDHAPNDLEFGPDGELYLSIGHVDYSYALPLHDDIHPNAEWLGTVLQIDVETGHALVFARGLRNVFGLAWNPEGRLLGVDNDGPTRNGWRDEELVEIKQNTHHGFPDDPSTGPGTVRTAWPIFLTHTTGTAGIAWHDDGVLIGDCGSVRHVPLAVRNGSLALSGQRFDVSTVVGDIPGCATSVVPVDGRLLVAVFQGARGSMLLTDQLDGRGR